MQLTFFINEKVNLNINLPCRDIADRIHVMAAINQLFSYWALQDEFCKTQQSQYT